MVYIKVFSKIFAEALTEDIIRLSCDIHFKSYTWLHVEGKSLIEKQFFL